MDNFKILILKSNRERDIEESADTIIADVRNKLGPIQNLISMLESSELMYHENPKVHKIIKSEIENVKNSLKYLSNK